MNIRDYYIARIRKHNADFTNSQLEAVFAACDEQEIYNIMHNNTSWKLLVLKVRWHELLHTLVPFVYRHFTYPSELVDMVNKWHPNT